MKQTDIQKTGKKIKQAQKESSNKQKPNEVEDYYKKNKIQNFCREVKKGKIRQDAICLR